MSNGLWMRREEGTTPTSGDRAETTPGAAGPPPPLKRWF